MIEKQTTIKHVTAPRAISADQVTGLALELSRLPDGTVNLDIFAKNAEFALDVLYDIQNRIDRITQAEA